ncbi:MAG: GIY-YIG nuclease family protein [Acidimicrobiia bacterium]
MELFYVGIAPRDEKSSATLKSRIDKNHLGGNTGSSTFRFTLAALLMDPLELMPERTKTNYVLSTSQNQNLTAWQRQHLKLSWVGHDQPWLIEDGVIEALSPPLNLAGNKSHPFHPTLSHARAKFRNAARPRT